MFFTRFTRLWMVCIIALFVGMAAHPVFAGQSVDPSTLNPPPPPEFNPVCSAIGSGTLCTVSFTQTEGPGVTGVICGSGANQFEIVSGDLRTVDGRRYYNQDGNLTQRHFREVMVGKLTNPLTGAYLNFTQADTVIHDLAVPGDISTGTDHISGMWSASLPNGGTVFTDTGTTVLTEADGTVLFESAHHPLDAYYGQGDTSAIQPLCDALMN